MARTTGCGWAEQGPTEYHLHFAFLPDSGYFNIGGCTLSIANSDFICGSNNIYALGVLTNGGDSSIPPQPTTGPGTPSPTPYPGGNEPPAMGGEHLWNGLVLAFVGLFDNTAESILPSHTPMGLYAYTDKIFTTFSDFAWLFAASSLVWITPALICYGVIITLEAVRMLYAAYRLIIGLLPAP